MPDNFADNVSATIKNIKAECRNSSFMLSEIGRMTRDQSKTQYVTLEGYCTGCKHFYYDTGILTSKNVYCQILRDAENKL